MALDFHGCDHLSYNSKCLGTRNTRISLDTVQGLHIQRTKGNPVRPYFEVSRPDLHVLSAKTLHIRPSDKPDLSTSSLGTFENWMCTARRIFFF